MVGIIVLYMEKNICMFMCAIYVVVYGEEYMYVCVWRRIYVCLYVWCMQLCMEKDICMFMCGVYAVM